MHWRFVLGWFGAPTALAASSAGTVPAPAPVPTITPGRRLPLLATASTFALLSLCVVTRALVLGHAPISNMYEYSVALAWAISGYTLAFELRLRAAWIGAAALPVVVAVLGIAATFPATPEPLQPALQNSRMLAIHVSAMVLAYGAFAIAFGAASLSLIQGDGPRFSALPGHRQLDDITHTAVLIGFPILALGIILGAWWANAAWGRYWGWDPKETSALATWLLFAAYLHARTVRPWRGVRSSWLIVAGFSAVMFTFFAVNLWVAGLHSYAGV